MIDINELAHEVSARTSFQARTTVLGYVQRGGKPSARDRVMASQMGVKAVEALLAGESGTCVCINNEKMITKPIKEVLGHNDQVLDDKYKVFKRLW